MDPDGRSGGLLLGWDEGVTIFQILHTTFSIEVEFETIDSGGKLWGIFVYASNKKRVRKGIVDGATAKKGAVG